MLSIILFSALLGFCLSPYRRPILGPDPNPGVDPEPIRRILSDPMPGMLSRAIGMFSAIAVGVTTHFLLPDEGLATISFAALAGSAIFVDVFTRFSK